MAKGETIKARKAHFASPAKERGVDAETIDNIAAPAITKGMKAGNYVRLTLTVTPETLNRIRQELPATWAAELEDMTGWPINVSVLEIGRWLLDRGLLAFDAGERPDIPAIKPRSKE
jgi:hypothetical protein